MVRTKSASSQTPSIPKDQPSVETPPVQEEQPVKKAGKEVPDGFEKPTYAPHELEIKQKLLVDYYKLSDEVERALSQMLQRGGTFEDVMACILLYIRKKAGDSKERAELYPELSKIQQAERMQNHVDRLQNDIETSSKLKGQLKQQAAQYIKDRFETAKKLWLESPALPSEKDAKTEIAAVEETLREMQRLMQASTKRATKNMG